MTRQLIRHLLLAAISLPLLAPLHARTWQNNDGKKIEAELTGIDGESAVLMKDGRTFKVAISSLSAADQEFIKSWKPAAAAEEPKSARTKEKAPSKKGLCVSIKNNPDWQNRLKTLNAGWLYTWKAEKPEGVPTGIEYVPMVFGKKNTIASASKYVMTSKEALGFKYLLGYNEPDKSDQAFLEVEDALAAWPKLMEVGLPLVSPAAANVEGDWMEAFMEGVKKRGYRVDYIAMHHYGGPDPELFLKRLERVHRKFGLPIWITEFAVADWKAVELSENRFSPADIKKFMREVLPKLERLDYVHRYAWFSASSTDARLGPSALFKEDGSLTDLGEIYAKH